MFTKFLILAKIHKFLYPSYTLSNEMTGSLIN